MKKNKGKKENTNVAMSKSEGSQNKIDHMLDEKSRAANAKNSSKTNTEGKSTVELCVICGMEYENKTALAIHTKHVHQMFIMSNFMETDVPNISKCLKCGLSVTASWTQLLLHAKKHLLCRRYFVCEICKRPFDQNQKLINHLQQNHNTTKNTKPLEIFDKDIMYLCGFCGAGFDDFYTADLHITFEEFGPYRFKEEFMDNVKEAPRKKRQFKCKICAKIFDDKGEIVEHLQNCRNDNVESGPSTPLIENAPNIS